MVFPQKSCFRGFFDPIIKKKHGLHKCAHGKKHQNHPFQTSKLSGCDREETSHYNQLWLNKNTPTNHYTGCITKKQHESRIPSKTRLRTNIPRNLTTNLHEFRDQHKNIHTKQLQKTTSFTLQSGSPKKQLLSRLT